MRLLLELLVVFFAVMTIYRRLIEPFIDGMRSGRKAKGASNPGGQTFSSSSRKKNINHPDPKEIQDAEFEEIK